MRRVQLLVRSLLVVGVALVVGVGWWFIDRATGSDEFDTAMEALAFECNWGWYQDAIPQPSGGMRIFYYGFTERSLDAFETRDCVELVEQTTSDLGFVGFEARIALRNGGTATTGAYSMSVEVDEDEIDQFRYVTFERLNP